jgi:hypothetical protein
LERSLTGRCSVYRAQGGLLGVGETDPHGELRPRRLLSSRAETMQAAEKHPKNL